MRLHLVLFLSLILISSCDRRAPEKVASVELEPTAAIDHATLIYFPEDESFLPEYWINDPVSADFEPLAVSAREAAQEIMMRALSKYPDSILQKSLEGVYLVGSLRFYDVGYGGTYMANARRIVLVYRESFNDRGFEQRFHHEFSSLLLKKNEVFFEEARWKRGNASDFVYRAPGVIEEQSGDRSEATRVLAEEQKKTGGSGSSLLKIDPALMKNGFLTPYNLVSIEQDLNETAAHLFTNAELWSFCEKYPRIDHKVDVLIDFYRELDPEFDRLYFRNLTAPITAETSTP